MIKASVSYIREIVYLMGNNRRRVIWLVVLSVFSSLIDILGLGIIGPYLAVVMNPSLMVDGPIGQLLRVVGWAASPGDFLVLISLILIFVFLLKMVIGIYANWEILVYSCKCRVALQSKLMAAYQQQPYAKFVQRNSSEYMKNMHDATGQYVSSLQSLLKMLSEGLIAIAVFTYMAYANTVILAMLTVVFGLFFYFYTRTFRRKSRRYGELANKAVQQSVQSIAEGIAGFKELRILGKHGYFHAALVDSAESWSDNWAKATIISMIPRYFLEFFLLTTVIGLVLAALTAGNKLDTVLPTLAVFAIGSMRLLPAANLLLGGVNKLSFSRHAISSLYHDVVLMEEHLGLDPQYFKRVRVLNQQFLELKLERVGLQYETAKKWALKDVSLRIRAGESVGIIGESGSGKTTLVDVMLGLLPPNEGNVAFNGDPLLESLNAWRAQIAYLPQEIFIVDGSLRANIALGVSSGEIDEGKVQSAINQSQLGTLLAGLPAGLDTRLGERGVLLSGGQRQRVALARAFYFGRDVLILDEATSSLDSEAEFEIVNEIKRLKGTKTIIAIAHRLSTLKHCDRLYRLKNGRIVSVGTYAEVVGGDP